MQQKRDLQDIIKNRPEPTRVARTVTNSTDWWKLFMTDDMIRIVVINTWNNYRVPWRKSCRLS